MIGRKDMRELTDEELMAIICTTGAQLGFAVKTVEAQEPTAVTEPAPQGSVIRLVPHTG
jgi:hypothetical protein